MNPKAVAAVINEIITAESQIIAVSKELQPFAAALPAPFNVVSNPLVQEALDVLPKLTPFLQKLADVLASLPQ